MYILVGTIGSNTTLALVPCKYDKPRNRYVFESDLYKVPRQQIPTPNSVEKLQEKLLQFLVEYKHTINDYELALQQDRKPDRILGVSFGIEGPVISDGTDKVATVKRDNLDISFRISDIRKILPCPALPIDIINDMNQIGNALFLEDSGSKLNLESIDEGQLSPDPKQRKALMLVSDGLGQSLWQWSEVQKVLFPTSSEGGHTRFAPQTEQQWQLCLYIKEEIKQDLKDKVDTLKAEDLKTELEKINNQSNNLTVDEVIKNLIEELKRQLENLDLDNICPKIKQQVQSSSDWENVDFNSILEDIKQKVENLTPDEIKVRFENVLSRNGMIMIYKFLRTPDNSEELSDLNQMIEQPQSSPKEIVNKIIQKATNSESLNSLCVDTVNLFVTIWSLRTADLGITYESKGGVYLGGIYIPIEKIEDNTFNFKDNFTEKSIVNSRNYQNNKDIPVKVYREEDIGLYGAICYAIKNGYINAGILAYEQFKKFSPKSSQS